MSHPRIEWNPKVMSGQPVVKGTRIPVATILRWLGKGMTIDELLGEYPRLAREDVLAAQAFAADVIDNDRLLDAAE
jgi:uncharacterized protein (DUF433 family)